MIEEAILNVVNGLQKNKRRDPDLVENAVERAVRAAVGGGVGQEADLPCACSGDMTCLDAERCVERRTSLCAFGAVELGLRYARQETGT